VSPSRRIPGTIGTALEAIADALNASASTDGPWDDALLCPHKTCGATFVRIGDLEHHQATVHDTIPQGRPASLPRRREPPAAFPVFTQAELGAIQEAWQKAAHGTPKPLRLLLYRLLLGEGTLRALVGGPYGRSPTATELREIERLIDHGVVPPCPFLPHEAEPVKFLEDPPVVEVDAVSNPRALVVTLMWDVLRYAETHGLGVLGRLRRCRGCKQFFVEIGDLHQRSVCAACRPRDKRERDAARKRRSRSRTVPSP
jgi:hypothetical protein